MKINCTRHFSSKFFLLLFAMSLTLQSYAMVKKIAKESAINMSERVVKESTLNMIKMRERVVLDNDLTLSKLYRYDSLGDFRFICKDKNDTYEENTYVAYPEGTLEDLTRKNLIARLSHPTLLCLLLWGGEQFWLHDHGFFGFLCLPIGSLSVLGSWVESVCDGSFRPTKSDHEPDPPFCAYLKDPIFKDRSLEWFCVEKKILSSKLT